MYNHSNNKSKVTTGSSLSPVSRIENSPAFGLSNHIGQLHKTIGNRAVGKMLQRAAITNQVSSNPEASIIQRVHLPQAGRDISDDGKTYDREIKLARLQGRMEDAKQIMEAQKLLSKSRPSPSSSSSSTSTSSSTAPLTTASSSSSSLTEQSSAPLTATSAGPSASSSSSSSSSSSTRALLQVELASPAHWKSEVSSTYKSIAWHKYGWSFADKDKQERDLKLINDFIVKKENNGVSYNDTDFLPKVQYTVNGNTYSTHNDSSQLYPMHGTDITNGIGPIELGRAMKKLEILDDSVKIKLYQIHLELEASKDASAEGKVETKEKKKGVGQLSSADLKKFLEGYEKLAKVKKVKKVKKKKGNR